MLINHSFFEKDAIIRSTLIEKRKRYIEIQVYKSTETPVLAVALHAACFARAHVPVIAESVVFFFFPIFFLPLNGHPL